MTIPTPLGPIVAAASGDGVTSLTFSEDAQDESGIETVSDAAARAHLSQLREELCDYFSGRRKVFTVPIATRGTAFQQSVWRSVSDIPYGRTGSYSGIAASLGSLPAVRAVAAANARNKLLLLVPCHRVVGSKGELTGYSGGLWRKKALLDMEASQSRLFNP